MEADNEDCRVGLLPLLGWLMVALGVLAMMPFLVVLVIPLLPFLLLALGVLVVIAFLVILVIYIPPFAVIRFVADRIRGVFFLARTQENVCALTIDDVPSESTSAILDVLKENDVKATFFVISGYVDGHEDVMHRIVEEGHHLGNHLTEDKPSFRYSSDEFEEKLLHCDKVLARFQSREDLGGEESNRSSTAATTAKWIRPGHGFFNASMLSTVEKHGYRICLGNVYPHDVHVVSEWINSLYLQYRTRPGSVIVVHDRKWTPQALAQALPKLRERFEFVTLHDLAYKHHDFGEDPSSKKEA